MTENKVDKDDSIVLDYTKEAKIELCDMMAGFLEGLGSDTAEDVMKWLAGLDLTRAKYFEFWLEYQETIEVME